MGRTWRTTKNGKGSWEITISLGNDPVTGKRQSYSERYYPPENFSAKKAEKEAAKREAELLILAGRGELQTKRQQKKNELQAALEIEKANLEYAKNPTVLEGFDRYIEARRSDVKSGTIESWRHCFRAFGETYGHFNIQDITELMMEKWKHKLFNSGLKYSSCSTVYDVIHKFFGYMAENKWIPVSPFRDIKKPPKPKNKQVDSSKLALTTDELGRFFEGLQKEPLMMQTMMHLMITSGTRRGEIAPLEWPDADLEGKILHITKNAQCAEDEGGWYITSPKSGLARDIPLTDEMVEKLREWKKVQAMDHLLKNKPFENKYIFEGRAGGYYNPNAISNYFVTFRKRYNLPGLHPHKLRHTFASLFVEYQVGSLKDLQEILGHADLGTTQKYVHTNLESKRRSMTGFGKVMEQVQKIPEPVTNEP